MIRLLVALGIVLPCVLLSGQAIAAPVYWVPDADGEWRESSNWSSYPDLPGAADDVTIDVGGATLRTITVTGERRALSLHCEENLSLGLGSGGTIHIGAGGGYVGGSLVITEYRLRVEDGGAFTANGPTSIESGELQPGLFTTRMVKR